MPWYKSGTVSVTQNSNAVIGTNTAFIANSRVGDGIRGPDGGWYEVTNIASNTAMSIAPNYQERPTTRAAMHLPHCRGTSRILLMHSGRWSTSSAPRLRCLALLVPARVCVEHFQPLPAVTTAISFPCPA